MPSTILSILLLTTSLKFSCGIECAACVDGKISYNKDAFRDYIVPDKGVFPYCRSRSTFRVPEFVQCETTCLSAELMHKNEYIGILRLCADGVFKNGERYTKPVVFEPVVAGNFKNHTIHTRLCNTDNCNFDEVLRSSKTPTVAPQQIIMTPTDSTAFVTVLVSFFLVILSLFF